MPTIEHEYLQENQIASKYTYDYVSLQIKFVLKKYKCYLINEALMSMLDL